MGCRIDTEILKFIGLFCVRLSTGVTTTILGPTLTDLTYFYSTSYEAISTAAAMRGFGIIPGSLLAGYFIEKYTDALNVIFGAAYFICIVCIFISPFVVYVQVFWIVWTIIGIAVGVVYVVSLKIVTGLPKANVNTYVQLQAFGATMGGSIAPIIANPFLVDNGPEIQVHTTLNPTLYLSVPNRNYTINESYLQNDNFFSTLSLSSSHTSVQYVFLAVGVFALVAAIPWAIHTFTDLHSKRHNVVQDESTEMLLSNKCENETNQIMYLSGLPERCFRIIVPLFPFGLFSIYFILISFIRTFSVDHFNLDRNTASNINTTFMFAVALSTIISILVTNGFGIRKAFFFFSLLQLLSVSTWTLFSSRSILIHWILSTMVSVTISGGITTVIAFVKEQIHPYDRFLTMYICSRGTADLLFVWLTGHMYDRHGSDVLYIMVLPLSIVSFIVSVPLLVISGFNPHCRLTE